ncbi:MAG: MBL fold metallo-hydrolase [Spirochaetaceae bacterium]|nr:MBL fold metallo-hydrolase [Spirochaetaceae bacterium]
MSITLQSFGAAGEVTGSKHLVEVDGVRVLVDCGAFQGRRAAADAKNRELLEGIPADSIEAVVLTHAHYDHCGLLPLLVKRGFSGNIFATSATRDLANLVMMDSAHIQARDAEYLAKQAARKNEKFDWKPLYDDFDVIQAMNQFITINYHRSISVTKGVDIEFLDAGHILGSALVRMTLSDSKGHRIVVGFTGDLGRNGKPIIRDPEFLTDIDYLVLESTYGDRLHEETEDAVERLAGAVRRTAEAGGKLIIPAFAVERTQELVFYLHLLGDAKRIPILPIWVDSPMATDATAIFRIHPECYDKETNDAFTKHSENPFGFASLRFSRTVDESKALNSAREPMIIISADGMCEAGRIQHHLAHNIGNKANTVLIVGYMAEGTLGRKLSEGQKEVRILGDFYHVEAKIEEIDAFSAHADYGETIAWLGHTDLQRLKKIFLVHGEASALESLKEKTLAAGARESLIVQKGESYKLA